VAPPSEGLWHLAKHRVSAPVVLIGAVRIRSVILCGNHHAGRGGHQTLRGSRPGACRCMGNRWSKALSRLVRGLCLLQSTLCNRRRSAELPLLRHCCHPPASSERPRLQCKR
jgi:hypothetical protein